MKQYGVIDDYTERKEPVKVSIILSAALKLGILQTTLL